MKKRTKIFYCNIALLLLVGCTSNANEDMKSDSSEKASAFQSDDTVESNPTGTVEDESAPTTEIVKGESSDSSEKTSKENALSAYSSKEIEYARVWLQLGTLKEVEGLNVRHIPAGTLVNPNDETSAKYPEDVIQLAEGRVAIGSVTYSGNGDGTINVYSVPMRWDSAPDLEEGVMREVTEDIINTTELVYVDTGDDKEIMKLIDVMTIN